ncbi:MAG TPA: hypothetical protein VHY22_15285 [Chthoniobacteraceae bacterium]|nr:hypothetical protein [Chthoniobacteraceae bacterium]
MSRWILTGALALTGLHAWAVDAPPAQPAQLPADAIAQSVKLDRFTVPTPGELLAALNKVGKPTWQAQYRPPIPTAYTDRPQIALNLGGLIADGYIAVEAEDSQQVKNIGKDIMTLAKTLGVSEDVLRRGKSIEDFAENNEWSTLKEDLEATQNEVKLAMDAQHDEELTTLVTLGGWIRGTEAVSGWIVNNYSEPAAKLLRQPAIIALLRSKLDTLPEHTRNDELVKGLDDRLKAMQEMVSFPVGQTPTLADVKKLHDAAADLITSITSKR